MMIRSWRDEIGIEELANALTHGLGLALSLAGFAVILYLAIKKGSTASIIGCTVYGVTLVSLYAASTLYHSAAKPGIKSKLQVADYCCIYLLIAGTYTPFTITSLDRLTGFSLLVTVWALSLAGIAVKIFFRERFRRLRVASYALLGWLGIFAIGPLYTSLGWPPLALLIGGGLSYSLGILFFAWERLPHHHAIFHVFVLVGSILHYAAIAGYVV